MIIRTYPPVPYGESFPLFNRVTIETSGWCNRRCSYCPVGIYPQAKTAVMSDKLFTKVVTELGELKFNGNICMFFLNEPLLDRNILRRLQECSATVPRAWIYIATNGDMLLRAPHRVPSLEELRAAGLNCLAVSLYDEGKDNEELMRRFLELCRRSPDQYVWTSHTYQKHRCDGRLRLGVIDMRAKTKRKVTTWWNERGIREPLGVPKGHCAWPHRHIVVRHDGIVPICCNVNPIGMSESDELCAGDANNQSLRAIWDCRKLFVYRYHLQQAKRDLPGCNKCTAKVAYAHVVRRVTL